MRLRFRLRLYSTYSVNQVLNLNLMLGILNSLSQAGSSMHTLAVQPFTQLKGFGRVGI